jgi:hypothetical protein
VEKKPDGSDNRGRGHQFIPITDFFNTHALITTVTLAWKRDWHSIKGS